MDVVVPLFTFSYLFGRGGASDTIVDTDSTAGNSDTLQFGSDVAFNQL